jgi:glycosyltransferase involved in cell wall biosynthesis
LNRFVENCERIVARWTDIQVSIADIIAEEYLSRGIGRKEQYRTIRCGVEIEAFRNAEPVPDLPGTEPRILMVGRLVEGKGFNVLLNAVELIDVDEFSVLIAGDGPLRNELESEIRDRDLSDSVFLLGYRDDIPEVMAGSDVFVLPSYREGTPLVIYEAMASGLPVVATDIAGIPEQVENATSGYLIPTGDSEVLSNKLKTLLSDSDLRQSMGRCAIRRGNQFTVEKMLSEYASLYTELNSYE